LIYISLIDANLCVTTHTIIYVNTWIYLLIKPYSRLRANDNSWINTIHELSWICW